MRPLASINSAARPLPIRRRVWCMPMFVRFNYFRSIQQTYAMPANSSTSASDDDDEAGLVEQKGAPP